MARVLTFGTFDVLHPGHLHYLSQAQERGELWVVVARDSTVLSIKGHSPIQSEQERLQGVQQAFPQAHALLGDPRDFTTPLRTVQPDLILLGYDQHLPPGVREEDLPCKVERASPLKPDEFKSSIRNAR
jgi:FAD synthetase